MLSVHTQAQYNEEEMLVAPDDMSAPIHVELPLRRSADYSLCAASLSGRYRVSDVSQVDTRRCGGK